LLQDSRRPTNPANMYGSQVVFVLCLCLSCVASSSSDENFCGFVSSRGLLLSCDVHPKSLESNVSMLSFVQIQNYLRRNKSASNVTRKISEGAQRYLAEIRQKGDGVTVYVTTTALPDFVEQVLPRITTKFKLITGDADRGPIQTLGSEAFEALAGNANLIKWFGQNAVNDEERNSKFIQLPIGMDYHTLKDKSTMWGPQATPLEQENLLNSTRKNSPAFETRNEKPFYSGHETSQMRSKAVHDVSATGIAEVQESYCDRGTFWTKVGSHRFIVSPPGNGVDCHRTWETIAMGSIPIVSDKLHSLYEKNGLNVVSLTDEQWGQLAGADVQNKMQSAADHYQKELPEAIYLKYWTDKIHNSNY